MKIIGWKSKGCYLHSCFRHSLRCCRWFGVFPMEGLDNERLSELKFNMVSMNALYCIVMVFGQTILGILSFIHFVLSDFTLGRLSNLMYSGSGWISALLMIDLARKWPDFIKETAVIEARLSSLRVPRKTQLICTLIFFLMTTMGLAESITAIYFALSVGMYCEDENVITAKVFKHAIESRITYVYKYFPYHILLGIAFEIANAQATFLWTFNDVMTMMFSIYLISYFQDLNKLVYSSIPKNTQSWDQLRIFYSDIVSLVRLINTHLKYFIMNSIGCSLYFICIQLFNSLREGYSGNRHDCSEEKLYQALEGPFHDIYYLYSFFFLILRVFLTMLLAANVNTAAQRPLIALYSVPTRMYSLEIQRFCRQITYTTVALSGVFFFVTRSVILQIVRTIITYELVLMQFGRDHAGNSTVPAVKYTFANRSDVLNQQ
nr:gustatory receptor 7 [Achelura yunnanensis]